MTWELVAIGFGLALLLPVVPFSLEYLALRRLDAGVFGTLMSLEPALALLIGWVLLSQSPGQSSRPSASPASSSPAWAPNVPPAT